MSSDKVKVSVVSYLNSKPFAYGIENSELKNKIEVVYDNPAKCAQRLMEGDADVGLVPVAVIPSIENANIISDYCISAMGRVESVLLVSQVPLEKIQTIVLDNQSRTSVLLARILAEELWKINPEWVNESSESVISPQTISAVVIGDRALEVKSSFKYVYDLAEEWDELTMLPFVFACWVSNKKLKDSFIAEFNAALSLGLNNIDQLVQKENLKESDTHYLKNVIQYDLDSDKRKAINLFLEKVATVAL